MRTVMAEFIGGPMDGTIMEVEPMPTIYFPQPVVSTIPPARWDDLPDPLQPLRYERTAKRKTPAGGFIYRYELA